MKLSCPLSDTELAELAAKLDCKEPATVPFLRIALENAILFNSKQHDYGPNNITSFGVFGVVVRLNDKMERLLSLFRKGRRRRPLNESVRDTFRDIANYGIIAYMVETNNWPKSPEKEGE